MKLPHTVLFVDDDTEDLEFFCEAIGLIDSSIKRLTCSNGNEALALMSSDNAVIPDFIFLDINMPEMDGKECFVALRKLQNLKNVPIIMCSTSKYVGDQQDCEKLGADFYLVKPNTMIKAINALQYIFSSYHEKRFANQQVERHMHNIVA